MADRNKMTAIDITYDGLKHWYKTEFEKLGWMILAKSEGKTMDIEHYKYSLIELKKDIELKLEKLAYATNVMDLTIMKKNLDKLIEHVESEYGQIPEKLGGKGKGRKSTKK